MLLAKNRKALFNFQIIDKYIAGIVLAGHEVKAVREGKVNFEGSHVEIKDNEPYVVNLHIGRYSKQSTTKKPYSEIRPRKLLLNKKEIEKIKREILEKGKTAVPLAVLLQHNIIKIELATVKGKKEFEKKQTTKEKQIKRDMEKEAKETLYN